MKGAWIAVVVAVMAACGCTTSSKRPMRPSTAEEFPDIPPGLYGTAPDLPRDQPLLTPKSNGPGNPAPGMGGIRGPSPTPGMIPGGVR
jgi:hypothetical protein